LLLGSLNLFQHFFVPMAGGTNPSRFEHRDQVGTEQDTGSRGDHLTDGSIMT
jgi:hypothetical protein